MCTKPKYIFILPTTSTVPITVSYELGEGLKPPFPINDLFFSCVRPPHQQSGLIPIPRYLYIVTYNTNTLTFRADTTPWFLHRAHLGVRWYRSDARCKKNAGDSPPRAGCCDMRAAVMSTPLGKLIVTVGGYLYTTTPGRRRRVSRARTGAATGLAPPRSAAKSRPAGTRIFILTVLCSSSTAALHTHTL